MSETKAEYIVSDKRADFVVTVCEWKDCDLWVDTGCGETIRGIPAGYKYCPFCGKPIKVTT